MDLLYDLHTHTIASGHAYSTLMENIKEAYKKGLKAYGFSDHADTMPGASNNLYFRNFEIIPRNYKDMKVFAGIEANITDYFGTIDVDKFVLKSVDYIIASYHALCIGKPDSVDDVMRGYFAVMENPLVKIIGHPDDDRFPTDYKELVKKAVQTSTILELNNSSLKPSSPRKNCKQNARLMLEECKKQGAKIIVNTDAHIFKDIGNFNYAKEVLEEMKFPPDLIVNSDMKSLDLVINKDLSLDIFKTKF